jgi:hypothetical protein
MNVGLKARRSRPKRNHSATLAAGHALNQAGGDPRLSYVLYGPQSF